MKKIASMKIEITVTAEDLKNLHAGNSVTKSVRGGVVQIMPENNFFGEIEYVDPADSRCEECGSSFGVHLVKCSNFKRKT